MARKTPFYAMTIYQGANLTLPLTWKDSAGAAIDVTGYSARLVARQNTVDDPILMDLTSGAGTIVVGTTDGLFTITMTAAQTAALDFDQANYQMEVTSGSGYVTRLLQGTVTLSKELVV